MLRSILAGTVAVGLATSANAPATISGVIRDPATKAPLAGAVVLVNGTADSAVTDARGAYSLQSPSHENILLTVKRAGFLTLQVPAVRFAGDTLHFDAWMHSDPVTFYARSKGTTPTPLVLVRFSPDSLVATIATDSSLIGLPLEEIKPQIHSIEVLRAIRVYGPAGEAGGVIRVLMKRATAFPFPGS